MLPFLLNVRLTTLVLKALSVLKMLEIFNIQQQIILFKNVICIILVSLLSVLHSSALESLEENVRIKHSKLNQKEQSETHKSTKSSS